MHPCRQPLPWSSAVKHCPDDLAFSSERAGCSWKLDCCAPHSFFVPFWKGDKRKDSQAAYKMKSCLKLDCMIKIGSQTPPTPTFTAREQRKEKEAHLMTSWHSPSKACILEPLHKNSHHYLFKIFVFHLPRPIGRCPRLLSIVLKSNKKYSTK